MVSWGGKVGWLDGLAFIQDHDCSCQKKERDRQRKAHLHDRLSIASLRSSGAWRAHTVPPAATTAAW